MMIGRLTRALATTAVCIGALLAAACERSPTTAVPIVLQLRAEQGNVQQTALVRSPVPIAPSVRVLDNEGRPIAGRRVVFFATRGNGSVQPSTPIVTDANGIAAISVWTLGELAGPQELTAVIADATADLRVAFRATANSAAPVRIDVGAEARTPVVGELFTIVAILRDPDGNAVTTSDPTSFSSSVTTVATVSPTGQVTVLMPGTTVLTIARAGFTATVTLAVRAPPSNFALTTTSVASAANGVAISSTGTAYVTHADARPVTRFALPSEAVAGTVAGADSALDVTFASDGARAFVASGSAVLVVDAITHRAIDTIAMPGRVFRVLASGDGRYVYATTSDGWISRLTVASRAVTSIQTNAQPINGLTLHPTRAVLLATSMNGSLYEIDVGTFTVLRTLTIGGTAQGLVVAPNGSRVFIAREGAPLDVRDGTSLERIANAASGQDAFDVTITPNGRYLIVSLVGRVAVLDAGNYVQYQTFPAIQARRIAVNASSSLVMIATVEQRVLFLK